MKTNAVSATAKSVEATIGFRVKSGWPTAVLLAGPIQSPQVLDSRIVELSDPAVQNPASRTTPERERWKRTTRKWLHGRTVTPDIGALLMTKPKKDSNGKKLT